MDPSVPLTILAIEDDEDLRSLLGFYLEREGYRVIFAEDGRRATELLEELTGLDLIMVDFMLPHMDGLQLVRHIRSHARQSAVPILMLTARSDERDVVRVLDAGANDYVMKPFRPQELTARVRRLLRVPDPQ